MKYVLMLTLLFLDGCSTSQEELMPVDPDISMQRLWSQQSAGTAWLMDARAPLRRPPDTPSGQDSYTRDASNAIRSQFPRLPDPDMVLYVFPHLNGATPVPGYSTLFPFYTRIQYALPGERQAPL